jgi:exopolysaccharide biosynthesis polyprenyl glycosylphosphotransferase
MEGSDISIDVRTERQPTRVRTGAPSRIGERIEVRRRIRRTVGESDALRTVRIRERIYRRSLAAADVVGAVLAVFVAVNLVSSDRLRPTFLFVMPVVVLVAKLQGLYDHDELVIRKTTLDELPRLFNLATLVALVTYLGRHFIVAGAPGTRQLLLLWGALLIGLVLARGVAREVAGIAAPRERVFMVGDARMLERLRSKLAFSAHADLVGWIRADEVAREERGLAELMRRHDVHRMVIAPGHTLSEDDTLQLVRAAKATGMRVSLFPGLLATVGSSVVFDDLWGMNVLGVPRFGLTRSSEAIKRALDVSVATVGLVSTAPLFAVAAAAIRLDSAGPAFFRQERVGRGGSPFTILKFRTMVDGAEAMKDSLRGEGDRHGLFKLEDDPRVTRVGRVLRRAHLDELPQLINVLRGEMSLVGPRPLVVDEDVKITGADRGRLLLTPGMTGPWQILGSTRVPLEEMVKLDYLYIATWSLWNDVKILVRTGAVVVRRRGA